MATSNLCYPPGTWAPEVSPRRAMVHSLQHSQPQVRSSDIPQQSSGTCGPPAVTKMQSVVHAPAGPTTSGKRLAKKAAMPTSTCRRSIKLDGESSCVPYNTDKPVGMQEQLQALQREDPQTVLIARRIHTLGFSLGPEAGGLLLSVWVAEDCVGSTLTCESLARPPCACPNRQHWVYCFPLSAFRPDCAFAGRHSRDL